MNCRGRTGSEKSEISFFGWESNGDCFLLGYSWSYFNRLSSKRKNHYRSIILRIITWQAEGRIYGKTATSLVVPGSYLIQQLYSCFEVLARSSRHSFQGRQHLSEQNNISGKFHYVLKFSRNIPWDLSFTGWRLRWSRSTDGTCEIWFCDWRRRFLTWTRVGTKNFTDWIYLKMN